MRAPLEVEIAARRWSGPIPADACTFIGRIQAVVPDGVSEIELDLELTGAELTVTNRYHAPVR